MLLTPRDRDLIELLSKMNLMTTRQISKSIFPSVAHTTVMRRLRLLEDAKFIRRIEGLRDGLLAWQLASSSAPLLPHLVVRFAVNKNTLAHDVQLTELRLSLRPFGFEKTWISDLEMKRNTFEHGRVTSGPKRNVPDGLFTREVRCERLLIAVELELSPKSRARYLELFSSYNHKRTIQMVWYLVCDEAFGHALLELWQQAGKYNRDQRFAFSLVDEVIKDPLTARVFETNFVLHLQDCFAIRRPDEALTPLHHGLHMV